MALLDDLVRDPSFRKEYCVEQTITNITELIARRMKESNMSQRDLARLAELSEGRISQLLDGEANMTLRTVASLLAVFGHVLVASSTPVGGLETGNEQWSPILKLTNPISIREEKANQRFGVAPEYRNYSLAS